MVDIMTSTGIFLDLDPDAEFEITSENPMMQEDRIPVPYSTAISFLPSQTNKAVFGYLDTMMLEPSVRTLPATILIAGMPVYVGTLTFDGIDEDGRINYTFAAKDLHAEWATKLWELEISGDVYYPLIVDAAKTSATGIGPKPTGQRPGNLYNIDGKYRNNPEEIASRRLALPVVPVLSILGSRISFANVNGVAQYLQHAVIFGTHTAGLPDVAATLPDIDFAGFVQALCRMFNCAVFQDGEGVQIYAISDVLGFSPIDWDAKVTDSFSSSTMPREKYSIGYSNAADGGAADAADPETANTLCGVVAGADNEFEPVIHVPTGDLYSRRINRSTMIGPTGHSSTGTIYGPIGSIDEILIDRPGASGKARSGSDGEEHSVDIGLRLIGCAPAGWTKHYDSGAADQSVRRMAPIIDLPARGADRPTDVYIALYGNGQACDNGYVIEDPDVVDSADQQFCGSLMPEALFPQYHQAYAAWLAKDRQVLSVRVELSVDELAAFRMWHPVRLRGRNFLVSKLSIRIAAGAEGMDVSAELIAL